MTYTYFFIARNCQRIQDIRPDPGEHIEVFELDFDHFLALARDPKFHHHWNLLPFLYEALLDQEKRNTLFQVFYEKKI